MENLCGMRMRDQQSLMKASEEVHVSNPSCKSCLCRVCVCIIVHLDSGQIEAIAALSPPVAKHKHHFGCQHCPMIEGWHTMADGVLMTHVHRGVA